jgi:HEAT repeat protein
VIHALGDIADPRAIEPIAACWTENAAWKVKCAAAQSLPRLGHLAVPVAIERIRQDRDDGIRQLGLKELARTNDPRVIDELFWLIENYRPHDSVYAARALIHTSGTRVIAGLKRALSHESSGVRNDAATALAKLAGADAIQPLIALLDDQGARVRETAGNELGKLRAVEAIPRLAELTRYEDWRIRYSAVCALGKIGSKDGAPTVRQRLDDPHPKVCDAAAKALEIISKEPTTKRVNKGQ